MHVIKLFDNHILKPGRPTGFFIACHPQPLRERFNQLPLLFLYKLKEWSSPDNFKTRPPKPVNAPRNLCKTPLKK